MFSEACVKNSLHRGLYPSMHWRRHPSGQSLLSPRAGTPGAGTPLAGTPPCRYTPWQVHPPHHVHPPGQVHPWQVDPLAGAPLWQVHSPRAGTPSQNVHPPGQVHPQAGTHPSGQVHSPPGQVHPTMTVTAEDSAHPIGPLSC